jgi:predicted transcriptional regulator YdeE
LGLMGRNAMEPTIVERDQILLAGFSFFGDPFAASGGWTEENEIGRLWNRFGVYTAHHGERIKHIESPCVYYELHITHAETAEKGHFEVFVGVEIAQLEDLPVEISVKMLPPTTYAVFMLKGRQITSDWPRMIYQEWMPGSGYEEAYRYTFQLYDQRFKGLDELDASALDVYVPVKPVREAARTS